MINRATEIAHTLAYSAARSDIECMCKMVGSHGATPKTTEEFRGCWYDVTQVSDIEHLENVKTAIEYLELRGLITRHSVNTNWLRVMDEYPEVRP